MFAPPAHPRSRAGLPGYGALYRRRSDGRLFSVLRVFARDRQVKLVACVGTEKVYVFEAELLSDFTPEPV